MMSAKRVDATSSIDGLDGTIKFTHYRGDVEMIYILVQDKNGQVSEVAVNRGLFEAAFLVVRYA